MPKLLEIAFPGFNFQNFPGGAWEQTNKLQGPHQQLSQETSEKIKFKDRFPQIICVFTTYSLPF